MGEMPWSERNPQFNQNIFSPELSEEHVVRGSVNCDVIRNNSCKELICRKSEAGLNSLNVKYIAKVFQIFHA